MDYLSVTKNINSGIARYDLGEAMKKSLLSPYANNGFSISSDFDEKIVSNSNNNQSDRNDTVYPEYNPVIEKLTSERNKPMIVVEGYKYILRHTQKDGNQRWVCADYGCRSFIKMTPLSNRILERWTCHEHEKPDPKKITRQKISNCLKKAAVYSLDSSAADLLASELLPSEISSLSPKDIGNIRKNISYARKKLMSQLASGEKHLDLEQADPINLHTTIFSQVPQTGPGGQVVQSPGSGSPGPAPVPAVKKPVAPAPQPPPPVAAAPPEVCLRWNSYHSNMQATFPSLLNNEQFVDVTLACEGRSIKCHKVMLSACSSYFEELLSQNPCQHPIIFMRDLKFWEVQALVEFMYTGEVNVAQDKLPSLLTAAEALQIKGLTNPTGSGTAGSTGSYAASQEDDSNTGPDIDEVSSPSYCPPTKKIRKRKATNPTSYHQKAQAVYSPITQQSSPISSPMVHQVTAPPGLTPMRMMSQPSLGIVPQIGSQTAPAAHTTSHQPTVHPAAVQQRIKKEPGSPQHSYLPPPHPPFTNLIKNEPDDNMDTPLDFSESESRKESAQHPMEPLSLAINDQGPSSNGSQQKLHDNGLSEDEDQTGSDCSDGMHIDPGEASDA